MLLGLFGVVLAGLGTFVVSVVDPCADGLKQILVLLELLLVVEKLAAAHVHVLGDLLSDCIEVDVVEVPTAVFLVRLGETAICLEELEGHVVRQHRVVVRV